MGSCADQANSADSLCRSGPCAYGAESHEGNYFVRRDRGVAVRGACEVEERVIGETNENLWTLR